MTGMRGQKAEGRSQANPLVPMDFRHTLREPRAFTKRGFRVLNAHSPAVKSPCILYMVVLSWSCSVKLWCLKLVDGARHWDRLSRIAV